MEWSEINCIVAALETLIEKHRVSLQGNNLSEDDRAELSNDLAYAEILLGKYQEMRERAADA